MSRIELPDGFPDCFEKLKSLFSLNHFTKERLQRLSEIHRECEAAWEHNLRERLGGRKVKYLLIAEAPPWTESGAVRYFYNTCDGAWVNRVWRAFFDCAKLVDPEEALALFASRGFLLADSLPFAEKYSNRWRSPYRQLVKSCSPFLLEKINDRRIEWAEDVRMALAFRLNGRAVMESFPDGIQLPTGQLIRLGDEHICADGSGYTSPTRLRSIFGIQ